MSIYGPSRSIVCAKGVRFSVKRRKRRWKPENKTLLSLGYESYRDYLTSALWKFIRTAKLSVDPNCEICGIPAAAVHHIRYDRDTLIGKNQRGLVSVCCQCHRDIEFTSAGRKRPFSLTRKITEQLLRKAGNLAKHI